MGGREARSKQIWSLSDDVPIQSIDLMYYSTQEASKEIKKRLRNGGAIVFTAHAERQMLKRQIDAQEVNTAICSAFVSSAGEQVRGEYRYKLASNLNGGLYVVVELPEDNPDIIFVTIFSMKK